MPRRERHPRGRHARMRRSCTRRFLEKVVTGAPTLLADPRSAAPSASRSHPAPQAWTAEVTASGELGAPGARGGCSAAQGAARHAGPGAAGSDFRRGARRQPRYSPCRRSTGPGKQAAHQPEPWPVQGHAPQELYLGRSARRGCRRSLAAHPLRLTGWPRRSRYDPARSRRGPGDVREPSSCAPGSPRPR